MNLIPNLPVELLPRVRGLSPEEFIHSYLAVNRPVIVLDQMNDWPALHELTISRVVERFGSYRVQVYDDLFGLQNVERLKKYADAQLGGTGVHTGDAKPYVRWYTEFKRASGFPWADEAFAEFADEWERPAFLPASGYLLPPDRSGQLLAPNRDPFPARGLFVSPVGARTRAHCDPWGSDAVLCQIEGLKRVVLQHPSRATRSMMNEIVNFEDYLRPGEVLFIPAGWIHEVDTVEDSVSLTWNFVHSATWPSFFQHVSGGLSDSEREVLSYFIEPPKIGDENMPTSRALQ